MKRPVHPLFILLFLFAGNLCAADGTAPGLSFKENKNQWDKCVLFATELQSGALYLSRDSFTFMMADTADMHRIRRGHHPWMYQADRDYILHLHVFRQVFENANAESKITGSDKLSEYFNFYLGNNPSKW